MNKSDLVTALKSELEVSTEKAEVITNAFLKIVKQGLKSHGEVSLHGIGKLKTVDVPERTYTAFGTTTTKPAHKQVKFSSAEALGAFINEK